MMFHYFENPFVFVLSYVSKIWYILLWVSH